MFGNFLYHIPRKAKFIVSGSSNIKNPQERSKGPWSRTSLTPSYLFRIRSLASHAATNSRTKKSFIKTGGASAKIRSICFVIKG